MLLEPGLPATRLLVIHRDEVSVAAAELPLRLKIRHARHTRQRIQSKTPLHGVLGTASELLPPGISNQAHRCVLSLSYQGTGVQGIAARPPGITPPFTFHASLFTRHQSEIDPAKTS